MVVIFLSACGNDNHESESNADTISPTELSKREDAIISTTAENSFVFDYKLSTAFKEVEVWIEKYESGKLVDDELNKLSTQIDRDDGMIILAASEIDGETTYHLGISDKGGTSSTFNTPDHDSKHKADQLVESSQLTNKKTFKDSEENILATITYSDDENKPGTEITNDFFEKPESHADDLNDYDIAYVLKAKFIQ